MRNNKKTLNPFNLRFIDIHDLTCEFFEVSRQADDRIRKRGIV